MEPIEDRRENPDVHFLKLGECCPKCKISFNDGNFKVLWIPPDMKKYCNEIMQCVSCRHLFSWKVNSDGMVDTISK